MSQSLRVLIVEDSEDDALLLVRRLQKSGYELKWERVDSPEAMRSALDLNTWDLVITDYVMPGFNALEALEILNEKGLDIPRIVVSGTIGEETAVATMRAGASDYLMKDNLQRLIPAIERELRDAEIRKERRRAQEALRESEQRYRSLVENVDIGVTLIDPDHTIVMTNTAQSRMFEKPVGNLVGKKCFREFERRETVCPHCPGNRPAVSTEPTEIEIEKIRPDGNALSLRMRTLQSLGEDGSTIGFIKVVENVTERKSLEEQLRQAAKMEAIGRLAGGVAHDFNNLLTAMIGYSNLLLQQMPEKGSNREKVVQINRAATRAADLTRQLLAFSRKQVLDARVLDLNSVVGDFEKMLRRLLGEDVELVAKFEPSLGSVRADRSQIEQILMNLAVNARDAMPQGGKMMLETANTMVGDDLARTLADVRAGEYVVFSVADTGTGMSPEIKSRIFDPFFTTKEEGKGTGLGLSTVYGIVKQHQGHISLRSETGTGTIFKVYLPRIQEEPQAEAEAPVIEREARGSETVLVVEDDDIVRRLACEVLEMLGYTVLSACDPEGALRISREHDAPIHLLLTDVVMPQMDGATLFCRLHPDRPDMRVLYVSGYTRDSIVNHRVVRHGVNFLQKPFTVERLAGKVRDVLDA
jgi:two-component system, cell cycle sensor histidine kinase and response regulator CckA